MRWEHKFPDVAVDKDTDTGLWRCPNVGKCFMCQAETNWVDLCFEAHLCSEECEQAAYEDIARRTQQDAEDRYRPSF